jgi:ATP-dependent RNA circularization protein (DNA/RNA ligase family)
MEGTKKLLEGQFRHPVVEYLKDNIWLFTEKIDGTNVRVYWDGHTVTFGGRTDNAQMPTVLMYALNNKFAGTVNEQVFEQKFGETAVTLYGEGYGAKIQKGGGLYREDVGFILFDVMVGETFLDREGVEDIAKAFGLDVVPIVLEGTIQEAVEYVKAHPKSVVAKQELETEGLVGVPKVRIFDHRGNRIIVKVKVKDFADSSQPAQN